MDAKKPIQQLVNDVLEQLKAQGYTRGAIREYEVSYLKLSAYVDENKIDEYSEAVTLDFMDSQFGFKLEGFFGTLPQNVTASLHHLMILWHYQQYGTVEFITRGKKKPFTCPECFQKEYDAFLIYCGQKKYTVLGLPSLLNPVQRFLVFLDSRQVHHMDDIDPAELSAFISIYIDNSQRYAKLLTLMEVVPAPRIA